MKVAALILVLVVVMAGAAGAGEAPLGGFDPDQDDIREWMTPDPSDPGWMVDAREGRARIDNGDGTYSAMLTIVFEADGFFYLAPSIRIVNGIPTILDTDSAIDWALRMGDGIQFKSQAQAEAYDENLQKFFWVGVDSEAKSR